MHTGKTELITRPLPFTKDAYGCSKDGATKALPKAQSQAAAVLTAIREHGPVSDADLVQLTGLALNLVNARRWQLCKDGHIRASGTRMGLHGVANIVYVVAEKS